MKEEYKKRNKTLVIGVLANVSTSIIGFIFLKFFITHVGTEINGQKELILSILSYFSLVDGGIIVGVISRLYIPIKNEDWKEVTKIVNSLEKLLRKAGIIYFVIGLIAAVAFATIQEKSLDIKTLFLFLLFFIHVIPTTINYLFFAKYQCLIEADNKKYIITFWTVAFKVLIYALGILALHFMPIVTTTETITIAGEKVQSKVTTINPNSFYIILLVFIVNMASVMANIIIYIKESDYYKKHLIKGFNERTKLNSLVIYTLVFKISSMIVFSTDTITLSIMSKDVSKATLMITIYALYNTLSSVIRSIYATIFYSSSGLIGRNINKKDINKIMAKIYRNSLLCSVSILLIIVTVVPIVIDMFFPGSNYFFPKIAILFGVINLFYICTTPSEMLIRSNAHFKQTWWIVFVEAIINISLSMLLIYFIGIYGVLIGTILSMMFKFFAMEIYNKKIWSLHFTKMINIKIFFRISFTIILIVLAYLWMIFEYKRGFSTDIWNSWFNPVQLGILGIASLLFMEPIISFVFPNAINKIKNKNKKQNKNNEK
ncbi:hypothetical protein C4B25_00770 [Mycoplasma todarodis]|uniref:Polysaccharide biosynthesis protein C-terminal domain-containing protein n=2 Tax=Mycoplasma todarodis TaxID=1937191 RepID=A0A4R0XMA7_9MOLU|nr:hypothetical protein C4B25_00770 [Mycoplasma todarodis]